MTLNPQQRKSVKKITGPCLIFAGPGTGKTFTIVEKIKYLIENEDKKYLPEEILVLTFSVESANKLSDEISKKVTHADLVTVKTFHGFCADILREQGKKIGIDPGFDILEPDDMKVFLHKSLDISPYYAGWYASSMSTAKDLSISFEEIRDYTKKLKEKLSDYSSDLDNIEEFAESQEIELKTLHLEPSGTKEERKETRRRKKEIKEFLNDYHKYRRYQDLVDAWRAYIKLKREKNLMDFSDLNLFALKYFRKFGSKEYMKRYKYLLVDEFQDTNKVQFELIKNLSIGHKNITIVGDQNQSIYGFRGAYRENLKKFKDVFDVGEKDTFNLDKSYRSSNRILRTAHKLILNNFDDPEECVEISNIEDIEGETVKIIETKNKDEEARKVAELVEKELEKGIKPEEICVLYRTHNQGAVIKQAFDSKDIPIVTSGSGDLLN
ncbi:MAG: AAA family ATPase, partial [Candidatus Aenigmarchaeota archaeon]|nr:AAA family ATPase [Candidatus Aenigmarchaeota archaeon]